MKKIQLQPAEGIAIADPEAEIRVDKIGYGNVLVLREAEHMAIGVAHVIFHDSTQNAKTSIINPMTYGDLAVEGLIQQMLKTHEAYAELTQETLAPRLGAVLVGGCRPIVGTALKKHIPPSSISAQERPKILKCISEGQPSLSIGNSQQEPTVVPCKFEATA